MKCAVAEQQEERLNELQSEATALEAKLTEAHAEQKQLAKTLKNHQKHLDKCIR